MHSHRESPSLFEEFTGLSAWSALLVAIPAVALIALSLWAAVQFLEPMPPRRIVLAAGPEGSALHALGLRYAQIVGEHGVKVDVLATRGAADNLERLTAQKGAAAVGFIVAGTASTEDARHIVNISNLGYVPLWCLARAPTGDVTIAGMKGKRLAVGAEGSGLAAWLVPLLAANGLTAQNTQLLHQTSEESVRALEAGQVDFVFLGEGAIGRWFEHALHLPGVHLMSFPRADAYARRFTYIVPLHLPAGTLDLAANIPDRDLALIGTSVMLAARDDIHPTVVDLFVDAARVVHSNQRIFEKRGEFPNLHAVDDVPVSAQAVQYAREGASLLRRYLPLWAADALARVIILAVPLLAVAYPLARFLPALVDVLGRRRLLVAYAALRRIDRKARARPVEQPVDDLLRELERIEVSVTGFRASVLRADELYGFRVHLGLVREALQRRSQARLRATEHAAAPGAGPRAA